MSLFTSKVDYALRALLDLAQQPAGRSAQSREIAARQEIPEAYLNQLLVVLRRAGLVRSIRGAAGGYVLGREPRTLTVGDVLRAFQGEDYLGCGSEEGPAPDGSAAWVVRELRGRVEAAVRDLLDGTTLADLEIEKRRLDESQSMMLGI
jgi:Rrf2 family protein